MNSYLNCLTKWYQSGSAQNKVIYMSTKTCPYCRKELDIGFWVQIVEK